MNATDAANPIDAHVGARIQMRRMALGLSRGAMAQALNLTVAQVEAIESGSARASAATLFELSDLLDVRLGYFFEVDDFGAARCLTRSGFHELNRAL